MYRPCTHFEVKNQGLLPPLINVPCLLTISLSRVCKSKVCVATCWVAAYAACRIRSFNVRGSRCRHVILIHMQQKLPKNVLKQKMQCFWNIVATANTRFGTSKAWRLMTNHFWEAHFNGSSIPIETRPMPKEAMKWGLNVKFAWHWRQQKCVQITCGGRKKYFWALEMCRVSKSQGRERPWTCTQGSIVARSRAKQIIALKY